MGGAGGGAGSGSSRPSTPSRGTSRLDTESDVPPSPSARTPTLSASGALMQGSFKSMTNLEGAAGATPGQAGTGESSLNDSDLIEALTQIRMTQSTDDSTRVLAGSPPPPPAVSIEQAMAFLTLLSRSSNHQERLLFIDCAQGVAKHLGIKVAQAYVLPRVRTYVSILLTPSICFLE